MAIQAPITTPPAYIAEEGYSNLRQAQHPTRQTQQIIQQEPAVQVEQVRVGKRIKPVMLGSNNGVSEYSVQVPRNNKRNQRGKRESNVVMATSTMNTEVGLQSGYKNRFIDQVCGRVLERLQNEIPSIISSDDIRIIDGVRDALKRQLGRGSFTPKDPESLKTLPLGSTIRREIIRALNGQKRERQKDVRTKRRVKQMMTDMLKDDHVCERTDNLRTEPYRRINEKS